MNPRVAQIESHGVDRNRYPFASYVYGRGWRGHLTADAARKAAESGASRSVLVFGGGSPQHLAVRTDTGATV